MRCLLDYGSSGKSVQDRYISLEFRKNVRSGIKNLGINGIWVCIRFGGTGKGMGVTAEKKKGSWDQALGYSNT